MNKFEISETEYKKLKIQGEYDFFTELALEDYKISPTLSILQLVSKRDFGSITNKYYNTTSPKKILYSDYVVLTKDNKKRIVTTNSYASETLMNEFSIASKYSPKMFFDYGKPSSKINIKKVSSESDNKEKSDDSKSYDVGGYILKYVRDEKLGTLEFFDGECKTIQDRNRRRLTRYIDFRNETYDISKDLLIKFLSKKGYFK